MWLALAYDWELISHTVYSTRNTGSYFQHKLHTFVFLNSLYIQFRRKRCKTSLAQLTVLLAPGHRAMGQVTPWFIMDILMVLRQECSTKRQHLLVIILLDDREVLYMFATQPPLQRRPPGVATTCPTEALSRWSHLAPGHLHQRRWSVSES